MRSRTLMTLSLGAAAGAGAMYLLDPEHGPARRREAGRAAVRQARSQGVELGREARRTAEQTLRAAAAGYQQGRTGTVEAPAARPSVWQRIAGQPGTPRS